MIYSAWGADGAEFAFVAGDQPIPVVTDGLRLLKTFEADSWQDACRQYHEWQRWEPYQMPGKSQ